MKRKQEYILWMFLFPTIIATLVTLVTIYSPILESIAILPQFVFALSFFITLLLTRMTVGSLEDYLINEVKE